MQKQTELAEVEAEEDDASMRWEGTEENDLRSMTLRAVPGDTGLRFQYVTCLQHFLVKLVEPSREV